MQQLLTYINDHRQRLFERWYSLAQRLEATARLNTRSSLAAIFSEYTLIPYSFEEHPSLLSAELAGEASFTLLLWSLRGASPEKTHQWTALATRLLALHIYREAYGLLPVNIRWLIEVNPENKDSSIESSIHSMQQSHNLLQVDGCICDLADASAFPALALGTKGLLRVVLEVDIARVGEHSIYGSILPNAAWRLTWALNTLKDAREDILIDGFYDTLMPPEDDEVTLLSNAPFLEHPFHQGTHTFLPGLSASQVRYAVQFLPSCTIRHISTIVGNEQTALFNENQDDIIPTRAQAYVDFYLVPHQQPEDICTKLRNHLDRHGLQDVHIHVLTRVPSIHTSLRHPFIQTINTATTMTRTDGYVDTERLALIPFATEKVFSHPLSSTLNMLTTPIIFHQFGPLNTDSHFDMQAYAIHYAHMTHFLALLEELRYATGTTC